MTIKPKFPAKRINNLLTEWQRSPSTKWRARAASMAIKFFWPAAQCSSSEIQWAEPSRGGGSQLMPSTAPARNTINFDRSIFIAREQAQWWLGDNVIPPKCEKSRWLAGPVRVSDWGRFVLFMILAVMTALVMLGGPELRAEVNMTARVQARAILSKHCALAARSFPRIVSLRAR